MTTSAQDRALEIVEVQSVDRIEVAQPVGFGSGRDYVKKHLKTQYVVCTYPAAAGRRLCRCGAPGWRRDCVVPPQHRRKSLQANPVRPNKLINIRWMGAWHRNCFSWGMGFPATMQWTPPNVPHMEPTA